MICVFGRNTDVHIIQRFPHFLNFQVRHLTHINRDNNNKNNNKMRRKDYSVYKVKGKRTKIQSIPKRCIHIIIWNINLVYTSVWDTLYINLSKK
jgi:hypothetical protein